jgi:hypothetical protein
MILYFGRVTSLAFLLMIGVHTDVFPEHASEAKTRLLAFEQIRFPDKLHLLHELQAQLPVVLPLHDPARCFLHQLLVLLEIKQQLF